MTTVAGQPRTLKIVKWSSTTNSGHVQITANGKQALYFVCFDHFGDEGEAVYIWSEEGRPLSEAYQTSGYGCSCPAGRHGKGGKHVHATRRMIELRVI